MGKISEIKESLRLALVRKQDACSHLKAPKMPRGASLKLLQHHVNKDIGPSDYNMMYHMYVDGSQKIRCITCKKTWTPDSLDWEDAKRMFKLSSNTMSMAEQPLYLRVRFSNGIYKNLNREEMFELFPNWNGKMGIFEEVTVRESNGE